MSDENNNLNNQVDENITEAVQEPVTEAVQEPVSEIVTEPKAEPEIPKKSKTPVIIGVVAVAVVAVVAFMLSSNPKAELANAFTATGTAIAERESVFKQIISPGVAEMLSNGKYTLTQDISIINMPGYEDVNGVGVSVEANVDNTAKQANLSLKGDYQGMSLDVLNAYTDNESILINMPMASTTVFSMSTVDILGQIKNSPVFSQYIEDINDFENQEEISLRLFDEIETEEIDDAVVKAYMDNFNALKESMQYSKAEAKEFELASGTTKCVGYTVEIAGADATDFLKNTINDVYACESVKESVKEAALANYLAAGYSSSDEYIAELDGAIQDFTTNAMVGDVKANFYINKGIVVDSEITADVTYEGSTVKFTVNGGLDTDNSLDLALTLTAPDNSNMVIAYNDSVENADSLKESYAVSMSGEGAKVAVAFESDYDASNGTLQAAVKATTDDAEAMALNITGSVVSDDTTTKLDLTNIEAVAQGESLGSFGYTLDIKSLDGEVTKPEGKVVNIFEINEDEYSEIMSELQAGLFGVLMEMQ